VFHEKTRATIVACMLLLATSLHVSCSGVTHTEQLFADAVLWFINEPIMLTAGWWSSKSTDGIAAHLSVAVYCNMP
jgi:hypothetical protein